MICPECGVENSDSAKFCKNCGTSLNPVATMKKSTSNESRYDKSGIFNSNGSSPSSFESNKSGGDNKNLIIICLTVIICAVLIAGGLIFLSNDGSNGNPNDVSNMNSSVSLPGDSQDTANTSVVETDTKNTGSDMKIISGSFSTGSSLNDKTYCSVYVGKQYAGENVKISVLYSRDGSNLNKGNIVPKTVDSDGYISVPSADSFKYYPDRGFITIYDSNGNVLDTLDVSMSPKAGTQSF